MSGIPWQQVRGAHIDPSAIKFTNLQNKQNLFENELFKPPTAQLKIISVDTHDRLAYNDNFFFGKLKYANSQYFMPYEPDGTHLILWCKFNHLGRLIKDYSMAVNIEDYPLITGHRISAHGDPILCRGPDDGVKGGTIVSRINTRDTIDYYSVNNPESYNLGILPQTEGFSLFFRFLLEGDPVQHNGVDPTLWYHTDDPGGDYGTILRVGTNRQLKFFVNDNANPFNFISPNGIITSNVWHDACLTYKPTGNVLTMTVDDVPMADSANETPTFDGGNNSVFLGASAENFGVDIKGKFVGRLADVRWYRNLVFIRDHETNIWNNRRSICAANVVNFDGVNDYIDLTNDATLWSQSLTKFSFSFWIYPTVFDSNDRRILEHGVASNQGFGCYIDGGVAGRINFRIKNSVGTTITAFNNNLVLNKWNFVTGTYDNSLGSGNIKMFVGRIAGTNANITEAINLSTTLKISDNTNDLAGTIRDLRWWTTIALTPAQMELVEINDPTAPTPNYWLKLNEGNGNPVDAITRTKIGTLNGSTWAIGSLPRPIEYGKLDVVGYARFNSQTFPAGFDSVGYDNTGFDVS